MSKIRGTSIIGTLEYVKVKHGEAARQAVVAALRGPVRDVVAGSTPLQPYGWYEAGVVVELTATIDRVCGAGNLALAREVGRYVAFQDVSRFFKWLSRMAGPKMLFSRAGSVWSSYYDDGRYVCEPVGDRRVTVRIEDWPAAHPVLCRRLEGWIERGFELTAGKTPLSIREEGHRVVDAAVGSRPFCRFVAEW
jgi:hypothetical protein